MGTGKQTLGYPSRTAAVIGLRHKGMTTREIASAIGIEMKTVSALEISAGRDARAAAVEHAAAGAVTLSARLRLRSHAQRRGVSVDRLIVMIIDAVLDDELVDAVLDDAEVQS